MVSAPANSKASLSLWFSASKNQFIVESFAINKTFGWHAGTGTEKTFTSDEMESQGFEYVLAELQSFENRSPAPPPNDPKAAMQKLRIREKDFLEVSVSMYDVDGVHQLQLIPMAVVNAGGGAVGRQLVVLQLPTTSAEFMEKLKTVF